MTKLFTIDQKYAGKRIDIFLTETLSSEYSRMQIQEAIKSGFARVNEKLCKPGHRLKNGEVITFNDPPKKELTISAENIPIDIVFEDESIIVVNKKSGMVTHPASGNYSGTLTNALLYHCRNLSFLGTPLRPGVVHRLDKEVSGLLVFAKTDNAYKGLVSQFKDRNVKREYIAFVKGKFKVKSGKVEVPIGRSHRDRKKMSASLSNKNAKYAVTYYKVKEELKFFTELSISLGTGRTHQIRVHMSSIKHPILGDIKYSGPSKLDDGTAIPRVMLHAVSLSFAHPETKKDLLFRVELPDEFKKLKAKF